MLRVVHLAQKLVGTNKPESALHWLRKLLRNRKFWVDFILTITKHYQRVEFFETESSIWWIAYSQCERNGLPQVRHSSNLQLSIFF